MAKIFGRMQAVLCTQRGAFDLPAIVGTVAVVAILTGAGTFSALSIIPWQQDGAASDRLFEVQTAQANRLASGRGYTNLPELGLKTVNPDPANPTVASLAGNRDGCYTAVSMSSSGKTFIYESESDTNDPVLLAPDTDAICVGEARLAEMLLDVGMPAQDVANRTGALKLDAPDGLEVELVEQLKSDGSAILDANGDPRAPIPTLKWAQVDDANGYRIDQRVNGKWELMATHTSATQTSRVITPIKGETQTFQVTAIDDKGSAAWPSELSYTAPAGDLENGDFENGLNGWTAGFMVENAEGIRTFEIDSSRSPGVVTPTGTNTSLGALQVRAGDAVRSAPFELATGTRAKLIMEARLAGAAAWTLEYLDADNRVVADTAIRQEMIPRGTIGSWTTYTSEDLETVPYPAVNARLVIEGSGSSSGTAAQFDNIVISKR